MNEFLFLLIIFHFISNIVFKFRFLILNKLNYNLKGWLSCFIHASIYTMLLIIFLFSTTDNVAKFLMNYNIDISQKMLFVLFVFFSHFIPDKFGNEIFKVITKIRRVYKLRIRLIDVNSFLTTIDSYISYVIIDNCIHLLSLYYIFKYFKIF